MNFIIYMLGQFKLQSIMPDIINYVKTSKSDDFIYNYIKSKLPSQNRLESYKENLEKKVDLIYSNLYTFLPKGHILDIGTENIHYLKLLEARFGSEAYGINIENNIGYNARARELAEYSKFKIYDKIIPYADKYFTLITILSVIHHISDELFPQFISEVCRVCKGYIYVKDVNLVSPASIDFFNAQHDIFEGKIVGSSPYYRNSNTTAKKIMDEFRKHKFLLKSADWYNNFNNTCVLIFCAI